MNSNPSVKVVQQTLRFDDLSAEDFERLCLGLLHFESHEWQNVQHYGQAGSDEGRDLVAHRNGQRWVVQCKRTQTFEPKKIKAEADKCYALDAALRPHGILFITSANVTARTRDAVDAHCQQLGFECEIWGRTDLDARVNRHPQLVAQFFGAAAATMNPALHQVAPPVAEFVGRAAEIETLTAHLQPNPARAAGVAIAGAHGTGGIGKTQLALKLVESLREAYPDAQLFINLRGVTLNNEQPVSPAEALQQFIRALEPAASAAQLPAEVSALRGIYLSLLTGRRALIVCDNAREAKQVEPLIPPAGCALIVTSRTGFRLSGMHPCHLDKLAEAEAHALLKQLVPHLSDADAAQLAALCGYFPLALRVYGNFLAERPSYPVERYAARIAAAQAQGALEPEIAAAFATSYDELLDAAQQQHWRQLAVFVADFDAAAVAAVWQLDEDDALAMLSELARLSLIEYDAARDRYRWHDLARVYAQGLLVADERAASELRYAAHYCDVLRAAKELYMQGEPVAGLQRFDAEAAHIAAGFAWATARQVTSLAAAHLCLNYPNAGAHVLQLRLHSREQIEWLNAQLAAARQLRNSQAECNALGNLGLAYADLGELRQAIAHYEQALVIEREIGDRYGEGVDLGNLGTVYARLGELQEAITHYEQALMIAREIGDRRGEGNALGNLGLAYADLGEVRQAIANYEQQLTIVREIGDRRGEGNALSNLGLAYADLGEVQQAIAHYEQALVVAREIGDRRGEGNTLGNLGLAYADLGQVQQAIAHYEQRLVIAREIGDRLGESNASWNMALVWHSLGETERARQLASTALQLYEAMESPRAATVRAELAKWDAAA